jgi:hypothetical protein
MAEEQLSKQGVEPIAIIGMGEQNFQLKYTKV